MRKTIRITNYNNCQLSSFSIWFKRASEYDVDDNDILWKTKTEYL